MTVRVMVTVNVQRDGEWSPGRTLTIAAADDATVRMLWEREVPVMIGRALGSLPEATSEDPDAEDDEHDESG